MEVERGLSEIVGLIYEAGLQSRSWQEVLKLASTVFTSQVAMLWTHDFGTNAIYLPNTELSCMTGLDEQGVADFKNYYYQTNVWVPRSKFLREGETVLSSELYPETRIGSTEFYADWLQPNDLYNAIGSAVIKGPERDVKLSFVRSRGAGPYSPSERQRLSFLLPHVRNAFTLYKHVGRLQSFADSLSEALERLSIGVVLFGRDQKVVHANASALSIADSSRAIDISGTVTCVSPVDTIRVRRLVADCGSTTAGAGVGSGGTVKVAGLTGEVLITVTPLGSVRKGLTSFASAVMFVSVPGQLPANLADLFRKVHKLTPAEAALAVSLVDGLSPKEISVQRKTSLHTVRVQLKSLAQKVGARRQAEVVRILLQSLPLAASQ